ncbi:hypothetical protein KYK30_14280 [Shinella yambaruensis]|uniref:Uncharacterized protein n=1 Tax=Shinella yambaruensis TaxID=415996 RepID=A0ABQ5ZAA8_9HYPH|nr:hypothetical protein [Shinella yambaruensis]MCJ8024423.1 hypothetical protein [Shinella yambaruensis]MCU7980865.1 hypothetical protein [Shinella yambaruensis]GLR49723.1 hypothetical protein GCM10007923_09280 [Shinella yambaruensis]
MTINFRNPIADLRTATGYGTEELSLISGLTVSEIAKIESGELVDQAKIARLFSAAGVKRG